MNETLFKNFQSFRAQLNARFLEREHVIDGVLASLITRQNCFLFGAPGTGKSELIRAVTNGFEGAKYFGYLLSPTTDPSELYGPVAVSKLLKDEYHRDISGYMPDCNVAFLDELFRGNSAVLNSLLQILNERTYNNGKELVRTQISSVVAATNSFPQDDALQAFTDRFLFRPTVEALKKPANKRALDFWAMNIAPRPELESQLTLKDLYFLQNHALQVKPSEEFLEAYGEVLDMLAAKNIKVSDRRRIQILKFMQGWAVVQGDDVVYAAHLHDSLIHIVYNKPEDLPEIRESIEHVCPSVMTVYHTMRKAVNSCMAEFHAYNSKEAVNVGDVNENVAKMQHQYSTLQAVHNKADKMLDSDRCHMTLSERQKVTRLSSDIAQQMTKIAAAVSRFKS